MLKELGIGVALFVGAIAAFGVFGTFEDNVRKSPYLASQCRSIQHCDLYAKVRQECAAAGDFRNCISVKMGARNYTGCSEMGGGKLTFSTLPAGFCWQVSVVDWVDGIAPNRRR